MKLIALSAFVACFLILNESFSSGASVNSENTDVNNSEKIPARARKAGGGGSRNRVDPTLHPTTEDQAIVPPPPEMHLLSESKDVIPVRARKAGGGGHKNKPKPLLKEEESEEKPSPEYSNESVAEDGEEKECKSDDNFYHIRGKRCVPMKCYYGRDVETGQCFDRYGGLSNGHIHRWGSNAGYRHKTNHKTFGLGRFGIRAGGKKGR